MSDSLGPHELQHTRLFCPPLSPRVCSNSCPLSWWCNLTISSSAIPFSFCLQSFPASGSFPMNWLFASGGQSIGASASASVPEYSGLISFRVDLHAVQGTLKSLLQHTIQKHRFLVLSILYGSTLTSVHDYWKKHSFDHTNLNLPSQIVLF